MFLFRKLFRPRRRRWEESEWEAWPMTDSAHCVVEKPGRMVGSWGHKGSSPGCFNMPSGVTVNNSGDIIIADTENNRIQVFTSAGQLRNTISGKGNEPHHLNHPMCVALTPDHEQRVVVTDSVNAAVKIFYQNGDFVAAFYPSGVDFPYGVAVTSQQFVIISDVCHHRIVILYPSGGVRNCFGKYGDDIDDFDHPYYIATNSNDDIIISDSGNTRVKVTDIDGSILKIFGLRDFRLYDEHFVLLHGITIDTDDNILIIGNNTIYLMASNGRFWEVILPSHGLDSPRATSYSPLGYIVVTEYDLDKNHKVKVFSYNKDDFRSLKRIPLANRMTQSEYLPSTSNTGKNAALSRSFTVGESNHQSVVADENACFNGIIGDQNRDYLSNTIKNTGIDVKTSKIRNDKLLWQPSENGSLEHDITKHKQIKQTVKKSRLPDINRHSFPPAPLSGECSLTSSQELTLQCSNED